jgi:phosphoenolpyruvate carboxylase
VRAVADITAQGLMDQNPVLRNAIARRNPDTDLINLAQLELLKRHRNAAHADHDHPELVDALHLSLNALAAAMQSTG